MLARTAEASVASPYEPKQTRGYEIIPTNITTDSTKSASFAMHNEGEKSPFFGGTEGRYYTRVIVWKRYELSNHLGNVLATITDRKVIRGGKSEKLKRNSEKLGKTEDEDILNSQFLILNLALAQSGVFFEPDIATADDYYPFGMAMPGRTWKAREADGYRYGFNGKENDTETSLQDYGFRMYDPLIARFISVDPLFKKFPMLTPFQFASNTPINMIDLDGLEGISYRVMKNDENSGKKVAVRRVIEADVHVAVTETGSNAAYTQPEFDRLKTLMPTKFNEKGYVDDEGLPVVFKFTFTGFDPNKTTPKDLAQSLKNNTIESSYHEKFTPNFYQTYTGVVIWKDELSGAGTLGECVDNKIRVDKDRSETEFGHTECHEMTHFFIGAAGSVKEASLPPPNGHHDLGGWMNYPTVTTNMEGKVLSVEGLDFSFSKEAAAEVIKTVPRVEDRDEK